MGHLGRELRREGLSRFKFVIISITVFLIGLERVHALERGRLGVSYSSVEATHVFRPTSLSDLPQALPTSSIMIEGSSNNLILPGRVPVVEDESSRRELRSARYQFVGYGALSRNHVPCPPRSGRSYYTPNCRSASGPVRPYRRGCSRISRCARG